MPAVCVPASAVGNPKMFLARQFTSPACSIIGIEKVGAFFYLAIKKAGVFPERTCVEAMVVETWQKNGLFCYSADSEYSGPFEERCPVKILDMLTSTSGHWANIWRDNCRVNAYVKGEKG